MVRVYRGPRAYRRAKPQRAPRVIPCPECGSTDWLVYLLTESAECMVCGSVFDRSHWHP